jgi:hypothetical protein
MPDSNWTKNKRNKCLISEFEFPLIKVLRLIYELIVIVYKQETRSYTDCTYLFFRITIYNQ